MSTTTSMQRLQRSGQPYTMVHTVVALEDDGKPRYDDNGGLVRVCQVIGFTLEEKFIEGTEENPDGTWVKKQETHDLGQVANLAIADQVAREWRAGLVGQYAIS